MSDEKIIKRSFGSNRYLVAGAIFAVTTLCAVITANVPSLGGVLLTSAILEVLQTNYLGKFAFLSMLAANKLFCSIIQFLPGILMSLGLLLAWSDSAGKTNSDGKGFDILYWMQWITYLPIVILFGATGLFGAIGLGTSQILVAFGTVLVAGIAIGLGFYLKKSTDAYKSAKYALKHNVYENTIAKIVIIVPAVIASGRIFLTVMGLFFAPFKIFGESVWDVVVTGLEAVAYVLIAMTFSKAREDSVRHA